MAEQQRRGGEERAQRPAHAPDPPSERWTPRRVLVFARAVQGTAMQDDVSTGQYLMRRLKAQGVDTVFGMPGVHTLELYRGIAAERIRHVLVRHEQGAGFMADGFARATGRPGVCSVITGPGLTNALTAVGQAYSDSVPMLVLSSVNPLEHGGLGGGGCTRSPTSRP